jgi:hypothetical protein
MFKAVCSDGRIVLTSQPDRCPPFGKKIWYLVIDLFSLSPVSMYIVLELSFP